MPALKRATFLALIFIVAPVCGLRPVRAARLDTEKVPKPTNVTLPPPFKVFVTASTKELSEALACVFEMPAFQQFCAETLCCKGFQQYFKLKPARKEI